MSETQAPARATRTKTAEPQALSDDLISRIIEVTERRAATRPNPMTLDSFEQIEAFAERASRSQMIPKDYQGKPDNIIIAVMKGKELGMPPIQALESIAIVNGRSSLWGAMVEGLCYASGLVEDHEEHFEGVEGTDEFTAVCTVKRRGIASPKIGRFSQKDAKTAGLYGKQVHGNYPRRMMQWRAKHPAFNDAFPDVLKGIAVRELEAEDALAAPSWTLPQPERNWFAVKPQAQSDGWDDTWFRGALQKLTNETNAWKWLDLLIACLGDAPTLRDVNEIGDLPGVVKSRETAPDEAKQSIDVAFNTARAKFAEKAGQTAPSAAAENAPAVNEVTQATGEDPNPPVADPVPADNPPVSAEAPPSEERSTQSPTSDGMEFSVWLVDGEGNELADSDGVFEPFTDPVGFARAYKEVEASLFPGDLGLFHAANEENIDWAMRISEEAAAIFVPPPAPAQNVSPVKEPALPLNLPPVDQAFIPPPTKSTKAEFTSYVDRFKVLLSAAPTNAAIDHLVTVNSVTTERSDFLNSSRLQIKAATEERRKALTPSTAGAAATMEQLAVDMAGEINRLGSVTDCDAYAASSRVKANLLDLSTNAPERHTQVLAAFYSKRLLLLIRSCRTQADAAALSRDVALIEQVRWLREHAPLVHRNTMVEMDAHVKGLPK